MATWWPKHVVHFDAYMLINILCCADVPFCILYLILYSTPGCLLWVLRLVRPFVRRILIASGCLTVTSADLHIPWQRQQQQRRCTIALLTYFTTVCEFPIPRHFYNWSLRQKDTLRMSGEIWGDVDRDGERAEPMFQIRKQALLIICKCVIS